MSTTSSSSLDRLIELSRSVLNRLDQGERLSSVIPTARSVAELARRKVLIYWIDCELYGLIDVPLAQKKPRNDDERAGRFLFAQLHRASDPRKAGTNATLEEWQGKREPMPDVRDKVIIQGVGELERLIGDLDAELPSLRELRMMGADPTSEAQLRALNAERRAILDRVRAYVYQVISQTWSRAVEERENIAVVGPDYRLVVDSLDALASGVGQELLSALGLLRSNNPADWSAAALVCRNVILKLGRTLFPSEAEEYESALAQKNLALKGEKELNRLCAFIDWHWRRADKSAKYDLERLDEIARRILPKASKGKRGTELRHAEAQQLVVDTFDLVSSLGRLVGLEPVQTDVSGAG